MTMVWYAVTAGFPVRNSASNASTVRDHSSFDGWHCCFIFQSQTTTAQEA